MPDDPVAVYQEAFLRLEQAKDKATGVFDQLKSICTSFQKDFWKQASLKNCKTFSVQRQFTSNPIDMNLWPTADQLGDLLTAYHLAWREADTAWKAVPQARQAALQPPVR